MATYSALIADDDELIRTILERVCEELGWSVDQACNGQEALEWLQKEKFDIALLDILMVPMSGFEVLDKLRTFSQVPVIVFTGRSFIADKALEFGANDYIAKPFDPEELVKKIRNVLDHREAGHPTSGF